MGLKYGNSVENLGNGKFLVSTRKSLRGSVDRTIEVVSGREYVIVPTNPNKLSGRNKHCVFIEGNGTQAIIRFSDNGKVGYVPFDYLVDLSEVDLIQQSVDLMNKRLSPPQNSEPEIETFVKDAEFEERFVNMIESIAEASLNMSEDATKKDPLFQNILLYKMVLEVIEEKQGQDGVSKVSQTEIGKKVRRSQTFVSQCLGRLVRCGCVEKVASGQYKVLHTDVIHKGPFRQVVRLIVAYSLYPELYTLSTLKQIEILSMSKHDFDMARGMLYGAHGSPLKQA